MRYRCTALAIFVLTPGVLRADEPPPLQLEELVAKVQAQSPKIVGAGRRYEASQIAKKRARALEDPTFTLMTEDLSLEGTPPMIRLQVSQMLPWFGKRDAMEKVAQKESEAYASRYDTVALDAVTEAKRLYYELYLNKEQRRINREQRALVDTLVDLARAQLSAGMPMHHDVLKMQAEAVMLDDELTMLEADRREMAAMLNGLLGQDAQTPLGEPAEAWSPQQKIDREALLAFALSHRPELQEMSAMEGAERAMGEAALKEQYPDVMVGAFYDTYPGEADMFGFMTGFTVPVWSKNKQRLDSQSANLRAEAISQDRAGMEAMINAELDKSLAQIDASEKRLKLLEGQLLPLAQQIVDAAMVTYPTGKTSALEVLDALRTLSQEQQAAISLKVDREKALISLARDLGASTLEGVL